MAAVATRPAATRRIPAVHTHPALPAAIRSRRRDPRALPTLAASGDSIPCPHTRKPGEKEKGERRRRTEAPGAAPPAAKPEPPARRSRTRGSQARLRPPASSASPSSRCLSASPTSVAAFLVTASHTPAPMLALRPVATKVRTPHLPSCGRRGHRAEAERSAPPRRHAAAGDAGHRARLG
jgi:hypothetical protein